MKTNLLYQMRVYSQIPVRKHPEDNGRAKQGAQVLPKLSTMSVDKALMPVDIKRKSCELSAISTGCLHFDHAM